MRASIRLGLLGAAACSSLAMSAGASVPLRINEPAARAVFFQVENSSNLATVGQSFGPVLPATYSASGNVGTLVISAETHEAIYAGHFPAPVPGSFTPIVIEIDLSTRHGASQVASGGFASGPVTGGFTQGVLQSNATLGVIVSGVPPFTCTSQAQVDSLCASVPLFCGKTCAIVSGSAYDPATGKLNMVGSRTESGCDGAMCQGPFTFFAPQGDLRLSEPYFPSAVPTLAPWATALLLCAMLTAAWAVSTRAARKV